MSICDDMLQIPLPRYLQAHKEEILHIFHSASGWDYGPQGWRNYFVADPVVSNDLSTIKEKCPNRISRTDVGYFASKARPGGYEELRRLFLACMIWGWGRGGKYKEGFKNTEAALSAPRLREVLEKSVERIKNAQIKEAYEGFNLKGCGQAFFTKFFYFVGQEWDVKPLPLILDKHVRNFLEFLSKDEQKGWHISTFEGAKGYIQYVCSMNDWAQQLNCPADNIEYFMFKEGKRLRKGTKIEVGVPNSKEVKEMSQEQKARVINTDGDKERLRFKDAYDFAKNSDLGSKINKDTIQVKSKEIPAGWGKDYLREWAIKGEIINCFSRYLGDDWRDDYEGKYGRIKDRRFNKYRLEAQKYEQTQEGRQWRKRFDPIKVESTEGKEVRVKLLPEQWDQLTKEALYFGIESPDALARLWILERLHQLHEV